MADISIRVGGDSSEAQRALKSVGGAADDAAAAAAKAAKKMEAELGAAFKKMAQDGAAAWKNVEESRAQAAANLEKTKLVLLAVGAAAVKYGVDAVKAYAEAERVSMQLARAAGAQTEQFERQADVLERKLGIDGEVIKAQQTLLLQWGAAPAQVGAAIRAINDYAVATGKDAHGATLELIRAVEAGGGKLKSLGIDFEATGDKAKDLEGLIKALGVQFGGAAETDAQGLTGQLRSAEIAMGNLEEAFGGLIGSMESKFGALGKAVSLINALKAGIEAGGTGIQGTVGAFVSLYADYAGGATGDEGITGGARQGWRAPGLVGPDGLTSEQRRAKEAAKKKGGGGAAPAYDFTSGLKLGTDEVDSQGSGRVSLWLKEQEELAKQLEEGQIQLWADIAKADAEGQAKQLELQKKSGDAMVAVMEDQRAKVLAMEQEWAKAGDAIGAALVNGIAAQIEKLQDGGEIDAGEMVGDILAVVLAIAGTAIGTYFGAPQVGAALGGLAGTGVRALTRKRRHDGGWLDEGERFHGGGWLGPDEVPIIGQTGERVLSRAEVARMGGRAGVDSALAGGGGRGGGVTINVSALDALSTREFFSDRGGQGFRRAVESGRGDVARLLGAGSLY